MPNFPPVARALPLVHGVEYHSQLLGTSYLESLDGWTTRVTGTGSVSLGVTGLRLRCEGVIGRLAEAYFGNYSGATRRGYSTDFDKEPKGIFLIQLEDISMDNRTDYWVLGLAEALCAGFKHKDEVLYAVVDDGTESTTVITGITVTNLNKYEVRCIAGGFEFYVNDTLKATVTTGLPTGEQTGETVAIAHIYCETGENATKQLWLRGIWVSQDWS